MNLKTTINSLGIILNILGVFMVYWHSPINFDTIDGGFLDDTPNTFEKDIMKIINV